MFSLPPEGSHHLVTLKSNILICCTISIFVVKWPKEEDNYILTRTVSN